MVPFERAAQFADRTLMTEEEAKAFEARTIQGRENGIQTETVPWRAPGLENVPEEQLAAMGYSGIR